MLFTLLLRASLVVVVGLFCFLSDLRKLRAFVSGTKLAEEKSKFCAFHSVTQLASVIWLGDMTFKLKRCYRTFEFKSHVGYSRTLGAMTKDF